MNSKMSVKFLGISLEDGMVSFYNIDFIRFF